MTGPNISRNGEMVWTQISTDNWTGNYLAINKLLPTVALQIQLNVFVIQMKMINIIVVS